MSDHAPHISNGVSSERLKAALADPAFAALPADAPLIAAGGAPLRVLHANAAALALFHARGLDELTQRCLAGESAGARRFAELAGDLRPGGPARLERLRFDIDGRALAPIFMCRRTNDAEPLFIAVAAHARAQTAQPQHFAQAPAFASPRIELAPESRARADNLRFVWRTDAAHRFVALDDGLTRALGWPRERLIGASFLEFAAQAGVDPQARLREALANRRTFSGVEARWPSADGETEAPVTLGAAPVAQRGAFAGYSGFGVIHLARLEPRATARSHASENAQEQEQTQAQEHAQEHAQEQPQEQTPEQTQPEPRARAASNVVALDAWKTEATRAATPAPAPEETKPDDAPQTPTDAPSPAAHMISDDEMIELSAHERNAFREIARALGAATEAREQASRQQAVHETTSAPQEPAPENDAHKPAPVAPPAETPAPQPAPAAQAASGAAALVERIDVGLMVCRDGEAVYLNRALLDALGHADAQAFMHAGGMNHLFAGRSLAEAHGADGLALRDAKGATLVFDARLKTIEWDGAPAMLITFRPKEGAEGEGSISAAGRLRALEAEARAYEAEARELRSILDTATDGVAVLDETGAVLSLNAAAEALFGYERREVAGQNFLTLFAHESHAAAQDYLAGLQSDGVRSLLNDGREVLGRARQGGRIPIFMTIGRLGAPEDRRFCAVLRDLTQWKNAERELKDARREAERVSALKSDFLAKISHEVRTPLNAILGFAEVMMEERFGPLGSERYKDYLKDIHASGAHVMSLVNDLLDLSKIEAGRLDLTFGSVDANRIVSECVSLMQPQALRERVIMRLSLAAKLPNLVADERSLRQIVLNILSNAVKFNQPGGQVIVSTALTDSGDAVLRVRDTGIGMSEREVETALEPFRQIETSRQSAGTGLGLPLTKAMVEANRATFSIRSRKGEGTMVEVTFPSTRVLAE
jgi:PAS domain S-box-containing protein